MNFKELLGFKKKSIVPYSPHKPNIDLIIDAGHGGKDWGLNTEKNGVNTPHKGYRGIMEKHINMEIANRLAWCCARHNLGYTLTRWGDRYISLHERVRMANETKAKLLLSIHNNYATDKKVKGIETFYYKNSSKGQALAERCHEILCQIKYSKNRYVKPEKFYILRYTKMPAILVECGYLTNPEDALYLDNENNQMQVAIRLWEFVKEILMK